jgi:hypothetical protein
MSLTDLLSLLQAHNWLGLIALLTLLFRKWTGPDSKFPITIPVTWAPTVTAAGGLIFGLVTALQQGQSVGAAVLSMLVAAGTGGFLDGIVVAVFNHDNAPVWARSLVFIFDDLTGGGTPPTGAAKARIARLSTKPPPPNMKRARVGFGFGSVLSLALAAVPIIGFASIFHTVACTPAQQAALGKIEQVVLDDILAGKTRQQIEADVGQLLGGQAGVDVARLVDDAITILLDLRDIPAGSVPLANTLLAAHQGPAK